MIFVGFAKFSVFLREEVRFLLDFNHAFHHGHGKSVVHGPYSLNVELELFLNAMQLNVEFSDDVFEFAFFEFELFFIFDILLQRVLINGSESVIFVLKLVIMERNEFDFVFIHVFEGRDVSVELFGEFEFEELRLLQILSGLLLKLIFHGEQLRQP